MSIISSAVTTVAARPYVFVFLGMFLAAAWSTLGRWRALAFLVFGYLIAFASEYSSIRNGFPYGHYVYLYDAFAPGEWIVGGRPAPGDTGPAGVPFFDSLSYTFIAYTSYSMALFFTAPLYRDPEKPGLELADTVRHRCGVLQWILAASFMTILDVIVDPIAYHGDLWFLGKIYDYSNPGPYFHIPITNTLGWFVTGLAIIGSIQLFDRFVISPDADKSLSGRRQVPIVGRALIGPFMWYCVVLFNVVVTFYVAMTVDQPETAKKLTALGIADIYILAPITLLFIVRLSGEGGRASVEERERAGAEVASAS